MDGMKPNPEIWCATLEDEHLWRDEFCAACGQKRTRITVDTPIFVPLGATPNLTRFSPTVQAVIARSYEGSLQQMADNNQPRPLPRFPFEKRK